MAEIDIVSKHLIQTYPADFARFALQRDDIEGVGWSNVWPRLGTCRWSGRSKPMFSPG